MAKLDEPISILDQAVSHTDTTQPLYSRYSELNYLDRFLLEDDDEKALKIWLKQFNLHKQYQTRQQVRSALLREIARLDQLISVQINTIIHHPRFQALEASWRGLWYLVHQYNDSDHVKIKILSITWREVTRDISKAIEFDQSQLFRKIYNDEFGMPGGEPIGAIIGDYQVTHRPSNKHPYDDIETLAGFSQIAAAAFAPFITGASHELFGLDNFDRLAMPQDFDKIFSQQEYIRWRAFRDQPDSRFVGLTLPRILMREPYCTQLSPLGGILYKEDTSSIDHYLWGNSAYAFAGILAREFAAIGWFGHIKGVPRGQLGGGLVNNLPAVYFETDARGIARKIKTDVLITDKIERQLANQGFIPLCQCYDTELAAFYSNQSVQKPQVRKATLASTNARLSTMLQHILCSARIAHYLKVIIRDKVGSFMTARACEDYLQLWINRYTTGRDDLDWNEQARYPLREAVVEVKNYPGKPGTYLCVMKLKPHYQLDDMISELELVTELAQS
ncbi:MAG: type VI secretion system contractile sheath large subunit [Gammaproteobacteria bacterium]|nr:type VI secretion system contractile sheath large subunit [Gammaproteobacteria bacterium]